LWAALYREFFRMVLLGQRRPHDVLVGDLAFIAVSIGGAWLATLTSSPATVAVCTYAVGATFGATLCALTLRRLDPWNIRGAPGILRAIVPMGLWSTAGAAIHWLFSQGYNYVVAATLDASAVAEIAATRLLIMPVNMLSTGIGSMMLPTVSAWLDQHSREHILRRVCLFALLLACVAICYFTAVWYFRGWLFGSVLRKHFANQDPLLLLWFMVGVLMLFRDQLVYLLIARSRLRALTALTLASAVVGLAVSYMAMSHFGTPGALVGVLCGEIVNVAGIGVLSWREVHFHEA
jgi:O-antigen/teichoic acid export membrane protein